MSFNAVELAKRRARERLLRSEGRHPSGFASKSTQELATTVGRGTQDLRDIREAFQETSTRLRLRSGRGKENAYRQQKKDEQMAGGNDLLGPTCSFFFQQRQGSLDLKAIARVDIEKVIKDVDVETIQAYLENIAFAEVTVADMRQYTDDAFLRLFRLAQLTIEYLLNVQHTLYTHVASLEKELQSVKDEQTYADKKLVQQDEQLKALKSEVQQKKRTMKTYELLLQQQAAQCKPEPQEPMESRTNISRTSVAVNTEEIHQELRKETSLEVAPIQVQLEEAKLAIRAEVESQQARLRAKDRDFLEETVQQLETKLRLMSSRLAETERKTQVTLAGSILDDDETTVSQIPGSAETSRISAKAQQTETDETEKDDKESLMQRLARSKVSPDLATARSMQLRRVLRLVRRKIHERTFKQWYIFALSAKKEIEARELVLMERVKLKQSNQDQTQSSPPNGKITASDPDVDKILERYRQALDLTPAPNNVSKPLSRKPDVVQEILPREEALQQVEEELYGLLDEAQSADEDMTSSMEGSEASESQSIVEQGSVDPRDTCLKPPASVEGVPSQDSLQRSEDRLCKDNDQTYKPPQETNEAKIQNAEPHHNADSLSQEEVSEQLQQIARAYRKATKSRFAKALRSHQVLKENRDLLCLGLDSGSSRTATTLSSDAGDSKAPGDSEFASGLEDESDSEFDSATDA